MVAPGKVTRQLETCTSRDARDTLFIMYTTITYAAGLAVVMAALWAGLAQAQESAASRPAATQPAQLVEATATQALTSLEGKMVAVHGTVARTAWSPRGTILFINFQGVDRSGFAAIVHREDKDATKVFGEAAEELVGKEVTITGAIKLYRGKPEIEVTKAEQIEVKPGAATKPVEATPGGEPERQ